MGCLAAPSAAGCTSCSAARTAPGSCAAAVTAAAADPGQDYSIVSAWRHSASPGFKLATAPLALANQQLSLLDRTCFNQAWPGQAGLARTGQPGSIFEHTYCSVDANEQFGPGSMADRPYTS